MFSFKDSVDILLVSVLIYQFFLMVRGTKGAQMILGLLLLLGLYYLSVGLRLYSLHWLLENLFGYAVIILVILFQDPLRDGLAKLGVGGGVTKKSPKEYEQFIDEIVEAFKLFQKDKIGAMVVIERNNGLFNYIKTGTPLDSKVHLDLIYAIFQSNGPLHDGAVIISDNTIAAAGCFLPLSKGLDIDRKFGARHRAAKGITEVSDAMALLVSEETGTMYIFFGGENVICPSAKELRPKLRQIYIEGKIA